MREILDASTQRFIKILEVLSVNEEWITFADLSTLVKASGRTVAEDISKLRKRWGHKLNIEVSKKKGVRLHNQNAASLGIVFADLFNDSVALLLIQELIFSPNNTMEFYQSKIFVSRSTLIRLLPKINRFLSSRGMVIQCSNNRYQLLGDNEQYLRSFCASFMLELHRLDLKKYDIALDLGVIYDLTSSVLLNNLEPRECAMLLGDDVATTYRLMFYIISLVREDQGYTIISSYPVEEEVKAQHLTRLQAHFPHIQKDNLRPIHQYLFNQHNGWDSDEEKALVTSETEAFLQRVFSAIPAPPDEATWDMMRFNVKSLYLSAKFYPFKTSTLFDRIYYFSLSLQRSNPSLYQVVEENWTLFSQNVKHATASKTASVLFWMCLTYPQMSQFTQQKRALLIADFGGRHAMFLKKMLSDFFNKENADFLQIDIAQYPDASTSSSIDDYDILITTIPNPPISHRNVFLINDYPAYKDFCEIGKALFMPRCIEKSIET